MEVKIIITSAFEALCDICVESVCCSCHKKTNELIGDIRKETEDLRQSQKSFCTDWKRYALQQESLLNQLFKFSAGFTFPDEIIPGETSRPVANLQLATLILIKTFFAKEILSCTPISPRVDNLHFLDIILDGIKAFSFYEKYTIIVADCAPVKLLNIILNKENLDNSCEQYVKAGLPSETYSAKLTYLILSLREKIEKLQPKIV